MADEDEVVLVPATSWWDVRAESGYHQINNRKAIWMSENLDRHRSLEVRRFAV